MANAVQATIVRAEEVRSVNTKKGPTDVQNVWVRLGGLDVRAAMWRPEKPARAGEVVILMTADWGQRLEAHLVDLS